MPEADLTIRAFQKHISERYEKVDRERGPAKTFVWLIEEVGELATAINSVDKSPGDAAARANLEEEINTAKKLQTAGKTIFKAATQEEEDKDSQPASKKKASDKTSERKSKEDEKKAGV